MIMNNSVKMGAAFIMGAAFGATVCYQVVKTKCEIEKNSYIKSVEESFDNRYNDLKRKYKEQQEEESDKNDDILAEPEELEKNTKPDLALYTNKLTEEDYVDYTDYASDDEEDEDPYPNMTEPAEEPYVISPNDYSEAMDYDNRTLYYYSADEIVTDTEGEVIENWDELIGPDALNHFGEYEEDSVHVRNEQRRCEYEIILNP